MAINERAMNGYLAEAMESQASPRYQVVAALLRKWRLSQNPSLLRKLSLFHIVHLA